MPMIDMDEILGRLTGWDLKVKIGGETLDVKPPSNAAICLFEKVRGGVPMTEVRPIIEAAIAPLVAADVKKWGDDQLMGVATAIRFHQREILGKNSSSIVANVIATMRQMAEAPATEKPQSQTAEPPPLEPGK